MVANPVKIPGAPSKTVVRGACPHDCSDTWALRTTEREAAVIGQAHTDPGRGPTFYDGLVEVAAALIDMPTDA